MTKKKEPETPDQGGSERILMVDDERPIVKLGKQVLENLGYHVETSTESLEGPETLLSCARQF